MSLEFFFFSLKKKPAGCCCFKNSRRMNPWHKSTQTDHSERTVSLCSRLAQDTLLQCVLDRQRRKDDYVQWAPAEPPFPAGTESYGTADERPPEDWERKVMIYKVLLPRRRKDNCRVRASKYCSVCLEERWRASDSFSPRLRHSNLREFSELMGELDLRVKPSSSSRILYQRFTNNFSDIGNKYHVERFSLWLCSAFLRCAL